MYPQSLVSWAGQGSHYALLLKQTTIRNWLWISAFTFHCLPLKVETGKVENSLESRLRCAVGSQSKTKRIYFTFPITAGDVESILLLERGGNFQPAVLWQACVYANKARQLAQETHSISLGALLGLRYKNHGTSGGERAMTMMKTFHSILWINCTDLYSTVSLQEKGGEDTEGTILTRIIQLCTFLHLGKS